MYSRNTSQAGLSDLGDDSTAGLPRRLVFSADGESSSSSSSSELSSVRRRYDRYRLTSSPLRRSSNVMLPLPPDAPQQNKIQGRMAERNVGGSKGDVVRVMNSVCTMKEVEEAEQMYNELIQIAKEFETWMLPPEAQKNSFL